MRFRLMTDVIACLSQMESLALCGIPSARVRNCVMPYAIEEVEKPAGTVKADVQRVPTIETDGGAHYVSAYGISLCFGKSSLRLC